MSVTNIPFVLNHKPGTLKVYYEINRDIAESGFDLFTDCGFDVTMCLGYPTMRARLDTYEGAGYYTACAWIQIVTRREFISPEAAEPATIISSVDTHPTLAEQGVPFFALGFPAEIFDAPCNNLNGLGKLDWIADTFLVTMPNRSNGDTIFRVAGFRWGYCEYDLDGKRQVEISPLVVTDPVAWNQHLPLLRSNCNQWKFSEVHTDIQRSEQK
jgi:hypothetical protein